MKRIVYLMCLYFCGGVLAVSTVVEAAPHHDHGEQEPGHNNQDTSTPLKKNQIDPDSDLPLSPSLHPVHASPSSSNAPLHGYAPGVSDGADHPAHAEYFWIQDGIRMTARIEPENPREDDNVEVVISLTSVLDGALVRAKNIAVKWTRIWGRGSESSRPALWKRREKAYVAKERMRTGGQYRVDISATVNSEKFDRHFEVDVGGKSASPSSGEKSKPSGGAGHSH